MKKTIQTLILAAITSCGFGQYSRLGWTNEMQIQYERMSMNAYVQDTKTEILDLHNFNILFGGSLIGTAIFDSDTKFFIGDYYSLGFGVGMGKKHTGQYAGSAFDLLLGTQLGLVSCYNFSNDFTVGLKYVFRGGDLYIDMDEQPSFFNGNVFYPTVRLGQLQGSVGFGGRKSVKFENIQTHILDAELKYSFLDDPETSWYAGLRYRKNNLASLEDANYRTTIGSLMITCGRYW